MKKNKTMNLLTPMINKENNQLVLMDFTENKVYEILINESKLVLTQIDKESSKSCFNDVKEQQKTMAPELPLDEILEVMRTEKDLSDQNSKHIFRREI